MTVEIKKLPKSEVELTITVPYKDYQKWEKKALEEISQRVKIDGFRAGHIPEDVLRSHVKPESIKITTLDYVFPQTYAKAVQEHDIQVVAQPHVDIKSDVEKEGDDFVYTAKVAVMPEIKMGDYKKIKVKKKPVKVEKKSIDSTIEMVMGRYAEWKDVDRKAKKEDRAEVSFEGFDQKGEPIPNTASKNHPVIIGSNTMIPGFEDEIIGMEKDQEKEFDITFPKDYHAKSMQGQKVKFKIKLNRLEEKAAQKLDEAMVEKITGEKQSVDEFKKLVEEDLEKEMEQRHKQEYENDVVAEIIKITKAEIPQALIDQEIDQMLQEQKHRLKQQGLEWEQFLTHIKKTEEDFRKEHAKSAEERIIARLGIQYIIKNSNLEVDNAALKKRVEEIAAQYPADQKDKVMEHYKEGSEAARFLRNSMSADKLFEMFEGK